MTGHPHRCHGIGLRFSNFNDGAKGDPLTAPSIGMD